MRWSKPDIPEHTLLVIPVMVLAAPLWVPCVLIVGLILGIVWVKRFLIGPRPQWSSWFAWYPVQLNYYNHQWWPSDAPVVWLERIERRTSHGSMFDYIVYRGRE